MSACRSGAQRCGHRLEIDLRLARSGDAFQQSGAEGAFIDPFDERLGRLRLIGLQGGGRKIGVWRGGQRLSGQSNDFENAVVDEAVNDICAAFGGFRQSGFGQARVVRQRRENALARRRHSGRRFSGLTHAEPRRRRSGAFGRARRHAQHHAPRGERPARDPIDEVAQRFAQRRQVAQFFDRLEIVAGRLVPNRPDDAGRMAPAERHFDELAGAEPQSLRNPIGIGGVDRDGGENVGDAALRRPLCLTGILIHGARLITLSAKSAAVGSRDRAQAGHIRFLKNNTGL